MSFSDELLGFWSKPKRRVFIAQWEQGFTAVGCIVVRKIAQSYFKSNQEQIIYKDIK